jgi:hypothetical protein
MAYVPTFTSLVIASDFALAYEKPSLRSVKNVEFTEPVNGGQENTEVDNFRFFIRKEKSSIL